MLWEILFQNLHYLTPYNSRTIHNSLCRGRRNSRFAGNWHYIWVHDLEELKIFAEEIMEEGQDIKEAMASIDYSEWEEFWFLHTPLNYCSHTDLQPSVQPIDICICFQKMSKWILHHPNLIDY